jgi:hypothetical protein
MDIHCHDDVISFHSILKNFYSLSQVIAHVQNIPVQTKTSLVEKWMLDRACICCS